LELQSGSTTATKKVRWLRKFDTAAPLPQEIPLGEDEMPLDEQLPLPALGCNVELTQVKLSEGEIWWTFGFEAFGTIQTVENDLRAVVTTLAARQPPNMQMELRASYPAWLAQRIRKP